MINGESKLNGVVQSGSRKENYRKDLLSLIKIFLAIYLFILRAINLNTRFILMLVSCVHCCKYVSTDGRKILFLPLFWEERFVHLLRSLRKINKISSLYGGRSTQGWKWSLIKFISFAYAFLIRAIILTKFNLTRLAILMSMDIFSSNSRSSNNYNLN